MDKDINLSALPRDVRIVGTSLVNDLQKKVYSATLLGNFLLLYLCVFATARYFLAGN